MIADRETTEQETRAEWLDFAHTGPDTLAGRYMRRFWHPVYRAADLPAGRAMPVRIMSEDFTLYRGEGGAAHALAFRCAHRGTQLSTGWVEGDNLRCFYHGWVYDGSGQCVEQPAEPEPFAQRIHIRGYPTVEYLGLIFLYMGELPAPPLPRYEDFEADTGLRQVGTYLRPCNFFNNIENGLDPVHTAFVHKEPGAAYGHSVGALRGIPTMSGEVSDWGITMYGERPGGKVRINQFGMPNLLHIQSVTTADTSIAWSDALSWRVPIDDETHRSFNVSVTHLHEGADLVAAQQRRSGQVGAFAAGSVEAGLAALRGELHIDEYDGRPDIVNIQDIVAQVGQGAIADREHEHLGRSDVLVVLLRKIWADELRALADDRPLRAWTRGPHIRAHHGT